MPIDNTTQPSTWASATRMLRQKATEGDIGDEAIFGDDPLSPKRGKPLDYLGHFANDDVAEDGHNDGAKKLGIRRFHDGATAKQGFRKIEGSYKEPVCTPKMKAKADAEHARMCKDMGIPVVKITTASIFKPEPAPLRVRDRAAKAAAKSPRGPLRSK